MLEYIGNIEVANLERLKKMGEETGVKYELGVLMTATNNHEPGYEFRPVFCKTDQDGEKLLSAYIKNTGSFKGLGHDLLNIYDLIDYRGGLGKLKELMTELGIYGKQY
jgi:hypothetical protein